jgi:beta-galactosidase
MKIFDKRSKTKTGLSILLVLCMSITVKAQDRRQTIAFNAGWQFKNQEDFVASQTASPHEAGFPFNGWETVNLPHTAKVEPLVVVKPWVGISWYKKDFRVKPEWKDKVVSIEFEAVMQVADVWLNGKHLLTHYGGYLPFTINISKEIDYTKENRLVVKTDNQDNLEVPPGKPVNNLDFCYYSGIYRNVSLIVTNPLHITDAVQENQPASGGIRVWFPEVSSKLAKVVVSTHVRNEYNESKSFQLSYVIFDKTGSTVELQSSQTITLEAKSEKTVLENLQVQIPDLWHPSHPSLYTLKVGIVENNQLKDFVSTRIGIRKFSMVNERLMINDEPLLLVGTNRHQEYPYIGNALSDNAQYRDAVKIKEAGFNIVRLSHYPQSPAFMDACDELGILTIAAIPGWQFFGNETFVQRSFQTARDLIRRDRNHASVVFWELSLNETPMTDDFMKQMVAISKEESPESKLITCGWINKFYDVYIPARQHAKAPDYWKNYNGKTPLFTGEYGDWEYFAQDAGLNQAGYAGLKSDERTSRQLRGDGEKRLLQQATNFQEAHNDNLRSPHLGDANWLMFDYNRGYSPDIESSGIMDIFRLPKFAYYLYKSQLVPKDLETITINSPMVKIASYWNTASDVHNLKVYSNCNEIALYLNDKFIDRKTPVRDNIADQLSYAPFVFNLKKYESGQLKAIGYIKNKAVCEDVVNTAGKATDIKLTYDRSKKALKGDGSDVVFVYATICDAKGNTVTDANASIQFTVNANGKLIGQNPIKAEAGTATILLQAGTIGKSSIIVKANSDKLKSDEITVVTTK